MRFTEWVRSATDGADIHVVWEADYNEAGTRQHWHMLLVRSDDLSGIEIITGIETPGGDPPPAQAIDSMERLVAGLLASSGLRLLRQSGDVWSPVEGMELVGISLR